MKFQHGVRVCRCACVRVLGFLVLCVCLSVSVCVSCLASICSTGEHVNTPVWLVHIGTQGEAGRSAGTLPFRDVEMATGGTDSVDVRHPVEVHAVVLCCTG